MKTVLVVIGLMVFALGVGAGGEQGRGGGLSSHASTRVDLVQGDPGSHQPYDFSGARLDGLAANATLSEPHCHTIGLGYPTMPRVGPMQACTSFEEGFSSKPSVPLFLSLAEHDVHAVLAPRFKSSARFTPGRDSEALIFLTTSRLLL